MTPLAGHTDRTIHRIAHFGTFDVENYGDLLFPLLVERRLDGAANDTGLDIEVVHVSPVGGEPVWGDCVPTISTEEAMTRPFDGVIVGGGHIIHGQACDVEPYVSAGDRRLFAYADLWLGSTLLADELGIPIVWNAPGVPGPFGAATSELAFWAASQADYLSVRDQRSCDFLERTGYRGEIAIGPDTALEVDLLWSPEELRNATKEAFSNRGHAPAERAIAIHMNSRYLRSGIREIASLLDDFCMKKGSTAILMALGPCHEDDVLQRQVGRMMKTNPLVIDHPQSLREIAACIRFSEVYLGSSLHGAITATSFGRPAIIVAPEVEGGHAKFSGFIDGEIALTGNEAGRPPPPCRVDDWKEAMAVGMAIGKPVSPAIRHAGGSTARRIALDHHWRSLLDALLRPRERAGYPKDNDARRSRLDVRFEANMHRPTAYTGILLDQARTSARFRESAQKSARRFRNLERLYRDLENPTRPVGSKPGRDRESDVHEERGRNDVDGFEFQQRQPR